MNSNAEEIIKSIEEKIKKIEDEEKNKEAKLQSDTQNSFEKGRSIIANFLSNFPDSAEKEKYINYLYDFWFLNASMQRKLEKASGNHKVYTNSRNIMCLQTPKETKNKEYEGITLFALFNQNIDIMFGEDVPINYAEKCVDSLNCLSEKIVSHLCESAIRYCNDTKENVYNPDLETIPSDIKDREILKYIKPIGVYIEEVRDLNKLAFFVECDCEWEPESGLQIVIYDDQLLYVGPYGNYDPWFPLYNENYKDDNLSENENNFALKKQ